MRGEEVTGRLNGGVVQSSECVLCSNLADERNLTISLFKGVKGVNELNRSYW